MLYKTYIARDMWSDRLYNKCFLCYITHDMLCYITHDLICYVTHDLICHITHEMLCYIRDRVYVI